MSTENHEILRGVITQTTVGSVGAGLLSKDQIEAFYRIAELNHPWQAIQKTYTRVAYEGSLPRIDYGDDVIEPASEAIDSGTFFEPTHDNVPYVMTKLRCAFKVSYEAEEQDASEEEYQDELVDGFTMAWGRAYQRLCWLGDTASASKALKANDGWRKQIVASGNTVDGSLINSGDISIDHFYAAIDALPEAWKQRTNELRWGISPTKKWEFRKWLSNRPTGLGDGAITQGADGTMNILGIPCVDVPPITDEIVLTSPMNTTDVKSPRNFRFRKVTEGLQVVAEDIMAFVGFFHADFVMREVEAAVIVQSLN